MERKLHFDSPFNKFLGEFNCLVLELLEYIHILFGISLFFACNFFFHLKNAKTQAFYLFMTWDIVLQKGFLSNNIVKELEYTCLSFKKIIRL
jgi:hypothetical protein